MLTPQEAKEMELMFRDIIDEILPTAELKVIAEQQKLVLDLVKKHEATIYGNGKEGLTTTVSRLDKWVCGAQKTMDEILKWAIISILGGTATTIVIVAVRTGLIK